MDSEAQYCNAREHTRGVVGYEAEVARRLKRLEAAKIEVENAESGLVAGGEALINLKKKGALELVPLSQALQALEEERGSQLRGALADLAGSALESASAVKSATAELCDAVSTVSIQSDTRTFLHQRRIAKMISEQTAMQDNRGGAAARGGGAGGHHHQTRLRG